MMLGPAGGRPAVVLADLPHRSSKYDQRSALGTVDQITMYVDIHVVVKKGGSRIDG